MCTTAREAALDEDLINHNINSERVLFEQAKAELHPTRLFRFVVHWYAERKLLVILMLHVVVTLIVWMHYAGIKWDEMEQTLVHGGSHYWFRHIAPPILFGSKHAILVQMALVPLTMSRYSIAALSETSLENYIPLNRAFRIHTQLGYFMVAIIALATVLFLAYFGTLCASGEQTYCSGLRSEIMITGYIISAITMVVGATSYFRNRIPYEVFYAVHHLIFVLYVVTILHTIDKVQRNGSENRYQSFQWFTATFLFYVCDRAVLRINHTYQVRLKSASTVSGLNGSKTVIVKFRRPALFDFKPGQYAFLRLPVIDKHWHPFSIASGPPSAYLEFYIEVFEANAWTSKLYNLLQNVKTTKARRLQFDIMGPCGTSLGETDKYSHALAIGSGTGIVPMLSLFKQHVRQLIHLDPLAHAVNLQTHSKKVSRRENASQHQKVPMATKLASNCCKFDHQNRQDSVKDMISQSFTSIDESSNGMDLASIKQAAFRATRSIYGVVLLSILPVIGFALIGWAVSWNSTPLQVPASNRILMVTTVVFQTGFVTIAVSIWPANSLFAYTDLAASLLSPLADWYWFRQNPWTGRDVVFYVVYILYMTIRLWSATVKPRHCENWRTAALADGITALDFLDLIWVTRSASQASEILPQLTHIWEGFVSLWGDERAEQVCRMAVYVTDQDKSSTDLLRLEISDNPLYHKGWIHFKRPDLCKIIEDHSLELIRTRRHSYSLLAFCGSPTLGQMIHEYKISNDMVVAMTGNKKHQMEFVSESYGGVSPSKPSQARARTSAPADVVDADPGSCLAPGRLTTVAFIHCEQDGSTELLVD